MNHNNQDRHKRSFKCRSKSSVVRDSNGSTTAFRRFYQSGGRDYEQYRLWLQAQTIAEQLSAQSTSSIDLVKIKAEPNDTRSDLVTIVPPSVHSPLIPKIAHTDPLAKPMRHLSLPVESQVPLPLFALPSPPLKTSFEYHIRAASDYHPMSTSISSTSSSSSLSNWSVADVARFIEKNCPEKNVVRKFIQQKIDGRTLPLLTEDHLTRVFKMKLGPALRLLSLVTDLQMQNQSKICSYKTSM